eukprot:UN4723
MLGRQVEVKDNIAARMIAGSQKTDLEERTGKMNDNMQQAGKSPKESRAALGELHCQRQLEVGHVGAEGGEADGCSSGCASSGPACHVEVRPACWREGMGGVKVHAGEAARCHPSADTRSWRSRPTHGV